MADIGIIGMFLIAGVAIAGFITIAVLTMGRGGRG